MATILAIPVVTTKGAVFGADLEDAATPITVQVASVTHVEGNYLRLDVDGVTRGYILIE